MPFGITEHVAKSPRHTTFYLACGGAHRPLVIFVHGWPELSISWRHQLPCFASLGFRAIAPDLRGYGRSSVSPTHADYALEPDGWRLRGPISGRSGTAARDLVLRPGHPGVLRFRDRV
jgi:pimeloyl-ACP methyl ester carboxylesterase